MSSNNNGSIEVQDVTSTALSATVTSQAEQQQLQAAAELQPDPSSPIVQQLINTTAPSIHSSLLIVDLLAHTISYLRRNEWCQSARVNHAWRNATLRPSAFPSSNIDFADLSPRVGLLHRACIRSLSISSQGCTLVELRQLTHLQRFRCFSKLDPKITLLIESLTRIHPQLTDIWIMHWTSPAIESLTRVRSLRILELRVTEGSEELTVASYILPQLHDLAHLELMIEKQKDMMKSGSAKSPAAISQDLTTIISTIFSSPSLTSLRSLKIRFDTHAMLGLMFTQTFPHLTQLELYPRIQDVTENELRQLARLTDHLPSLTDLSLVFFGATEMLTAPPIRRVLIDSLLAITHVIPHLISLFVRLGSAGSRVVAEKDKIPAADILLLLRHCNRLESFHFDNFSWEQAYVFTQQIVLNRLLPMLKNLQISFEGLNSSSASAMVELITQHYTHLVYLRIFKLPRSLIFLPPSSSSFLSLRDSYPKSRILEVHLGAIDIETQLPGLLRLLPLIDTIQVDVAQLPAHRFFEYAQYRMLALAELKRPGLIYRNSASDDFYGQPLLCGTKEFDLTWFDNEPDIKSESILNVLPSSELHEHFHRGVVLSQEGVSADPEAGRWIFKRVKGPAEVSHGWMFERVKYWRWRYKSIVLSKEKEKVNTNDLDLSPFLVFSRDLQFTYRYADDPTRKEEFEAIRKRLRDHSHNWRQ